MKIISNLKDESLFLAEDADSFLPLDASSAWCSASINLDTTVDCGNK